MSAAHLHEDEDVRRAEGSPLRRATADHPTAILSLVLVTYLMIILDTSVVVTGLPNIQADLGFSATGVAWVPTAYTLAFGGLLLFGARAGDIFGRRRVLVGGLVLFGVASLAVGAAPSAELLVAARAVQGIGAALLAPSTLALLTAGFAEGPARSRAVAAYGSTAGLGSAFGLVLGGLVAQWWSWRMAFVVNVPLGLVLLLMAFRYLPVDRLRRGGLDLPGAVVSTIGMAALVLGIVRTGASGLRDPLTLGCLIGGAVLMAVFVWIEKRSSTALLPLTLFADRERVGAYLTRFFFIGAMMTYLLYVSQFLQEVQGWGPAVAGLAFLPMTLVNFVVAASVPRILDRFGHRRVLIAGLLCAVAGLGWLVRLDPTGSFWLQIALPGLLIGIGQGLAFAPMTAAGLAQVAPRDAGAASGAVNVFHQLGGAVGLSIAVTLAVRFTAGHDEAVVRMADEARVALMVAASLMAVAAIAALTLIRPVRSETVAEKENSRGDL